MSTELFIFMNHCCVASYRTGFKMDAVVLPQPNGDVLSSSENGISGEAFKKRLSVERIYQKKTQLEHILLRPDSYIGSTLKDTQQMWVLDESQQHMVNRDITFSPGLYKIFDEILVNAADNKVRDPTMWKEWLWRQVMQYL
ncbi:unnamed protein product [Schistosoma margrebowiei]|uniref:DNA topoisomerase (ATP-hydrolyzing) n=1 Tax=Schistosoma margrebowiei TaxID=48269 RepID=A0A183LLS9_9TREM|nr:unnamed protein product [Schistosoma margrebowiei]